MTDRNTRDSESSAHGNTERIEIPRQYLSTHSRNGDLSSRRARFSAGLISALAVVCFFCGRFIGVGMVAAVCGLTACAVQSKIKSDGKGHDVTSSKSELAPTSGTSNASGTSVNTPTGTQSCVLSANPTSVHAGDPVTLTLHATGFATATINGLSGVRDGATITVTPGQTSTYAATAFNEAHGIACTVTVNVTDAAPDAPTCEIITSHAEIVKGQSVSVMMSTKGAVASATLSGVSVSSPVTSTVVSPAVTTAVIGTVADGHGLPTNCAAIIKVTEPSNTVDSMGTLTPEMIAQVYPPNGISTAAANTTVEVFFKDQVDPATVSSSSLTLSSTLGPVIGTVELVQRSGGLGQVAVFTPKQSLVAGMRYVATLAAGVKSASGNILSRSYSWTFQIAHQQISVGPPPAWVPNKLIEATAAKPVIYLYPTAPTDVEVKLEYQGNFTATYPDYDRLIGGWRVRAQPDGTLTDKRDSKDYNYLFWEGRDQVGKSYDLSSGFLVKGSNVRSFLDEKLTILGLTPRERNEFIVYWYPRMQNNATNLVYFAGADYTERAKLTVVPKPDSIIRVFMVFKSVPPATKIKEQKLKQVSRHGFSVVEWGGTEITETGNGLIE